MMPNRSSSLPATIEPAETTAPRWGAGTIAEKG